MEVAPAEARAERRAGRTVQPLATLELRAEPRGRLDVAHQHPHRRRRSVDQQLRLRRRAVRIPQLSGVHSRMVRRPHDRKTRTRMGGMQVGIAARVASPDDADFVRDAERIGATSAWVAETWGQDALTPLAYLAARTERIGLGSAI